MPEDEKKEKKDEKKEKDEDKVVLQVPMHCEACQKKVHKSMTGFPGVEKVEIDTKGQKVTAKGKIDAKKLSEAVKKKTGKAVKILYPEPKKDDGKKKEENKEEKEKKKNEPKDVTVVLKVQVHCGACSKKVQKVASVIKGVYDAKMDGDKLTIKGKDLIPQTVCGEVMKKSGKHAEIVPPKKDDKKDDKKEEKKDEKKDGKEKGDKKEDSQKEENKSNKVFIEYEHPPQYFSDENPNSCTLM